MSPSEVIIEVYIMPEDASSGALVLFQFKDPFLVSQGWRESLQTLSFVSSRPGSTAWLPCVLTVGEQEEAGGGVSISSRFLFVPQGSLHNWGSVCKGLILSPQPGPKGSPFSLLMDEGII